MNGCQEASWGDGMSLVGELLPNQEDFLMFDQIYNQLLWLDPLIVFAHEQKQYHEHREGLVAM